MPRESSGILPWRCRDGRLEVLLAHWGGPFWADKDEGAWSIVKGERHAGEEPAQTALREFREETGVALEGDLVPLGTVRQRGGKLVHAFACEAGIDPDRVRANRFVIEYPPGSGRRQSFPEIDRVAWFTLEEARRRILASQAPLLDRLVDLLPAREKRPGGGGRALRS